MSKNKFADVAAHYTNPKWDCLVNRQHAIYNRADDIRSDFSRDYNRILHSTAYRRLKHKTQVFFATKNDHICTRIEHVNHVTSVSHTIADHLGLNTELTKAIATGHDLGHAPFGHEGEKILRELMAEATGIRFWHEKNSLWFVDKLETLRGPDGKEHNLNLTYAVRDGIISHCGEVDEDSISPRCDYISLEEIKEPNQCQPYTWEGCVVKIADKISYLGRDIEDALTLKILKLSQIRQLKEILRNTVDIDLDSREINNTVLMHDFIIDLCNNSNPDIGISLSEKYLNLINKVKEFNYDNIYKHPRLNHFRKYARLIIESIFETLSDLYEGKETKEALYKLLDTYPSTIYYFADWLIKYSNVDLTHKKRIKFKNDLIYDIENRDDYHRAIFDFISGMTDSFAINSFAELTTFK
jgi:dGTPase